MVVCKSYVIYIRFTYSRVYIVCDLYVIYMYSCLISVYTYMCRYMQRPKCKDPTKRSNCKKI